MDRAAAARAAEENEAAFFAAFGEPDGCRAVVVEGAFLVDTGDLGFARVLSTSVAAERFDDVLARCREEVPASTRLEWVVGYEFEPRDLPTRLNAAGFNHYGSMPAMAAEIDRLPDWASLGPPGLVVDRVVSVEDLEKRLVPVLAAHFGPESKFLSAMLGAYRCMGFDEDSQWVHLVGSVDDGPVEVVGTAWVSSGVIGLGAIATLKESRGRGLGSAMTAALATHPLKQGLEISVLHATAMGLPVYQRLGYETLFTTQFYEDSLPIGR